MICNIKKLLFHLIVAQFLLSCSTKKEPFTHPTEYIKNTNGFSILIEQLAHNIDNLWGTKEVLIVGPNDYIKYTNQYQTRSYINFDDGYITIETITNLNVKKNLKKTITAILLTSKDLRSSDFYSDFNKITINTEPFLYKRVLDHMNKPIRWEWRAKRFADYLLENNLQQRKSKLQVIWSVTIQLLPNHLDKRAHKYMPYIRQASKKYGVNESLILAIMQTESSFNPYAVSSSNALGLMQIIPTSTGKDVFRIQGKSGIPSKNYLFNPVNNINLGTAYLSMLQNIYLSEIINPTSRKYAIITAYNSGTNNLLKTFHNDKKLALQMINQMSSNDVYNKIITQHPIIQSRNYLIKVNNAQKNYYY